jgi:outer membrane protein assembly factor BamD
VETYVALGLDDEATQVASVLGYNFPGSDWYQNSYNLLTREGIAIEDAVNQRDPSFIERAMQRIFG